MQASICVTCGVQFAPAEREPASCPICEDERQYVGWDGQRWTTLQAMSGHFRNEITQEEPGLWSIHTQPGFAIGQRALLVCTPQGNLLWDCVTHLDEATIARVRELGGIQAIAICHPHFYATCVEWSDAFGGPPVFIHAADREWMPRPGPRIVFWSKDEVEPLVGIRLIRLGGHFDGSAVAHWPAGAQGGA